MSKTRTSRENSARVKQMIVVALLCALAYMCTFIFHFRVAFLTFDAKDAVLALASFLYGPVAGVMSSLVVSFVELFTIGGETGVYGFLMNFISSAIFAGVAGLVYKYRHTLGGAVAGLAAAAVSVTAAMMVFNLLVTPHYLHISMGEVAALIPTLLLPFNLVKAILNAGLSYVLYRPVRSALQAARMLPPSAHQGTVSKKTAVAAFVVALLVIAAAVICFIFVLNGQFELFTPLDKGPQA